MMNVYRFLILMVSVVLSVSVRAETVGGGESVWDSSPGGPVSDNSVIASELAQVKKSLAKVGSNDNKFTMINKCIPNASCFSYVVDLQSGEIVDSFPTINGAGKMGCGAKSTEPGIFQMAKKSTPPGSPEDHANWGSDVSLFTLEPINDPLVTRCPKHDTDKVVHARRDVSDKDTPTSTKNTAGCVGMPENKYKELKDKYAALGVVIYNVENLQGPSH